MTTVELTRKQRNLLRWLAREDASRYGECHGPDLDALHAAGFVRTWTADPNTDVWPPPSLRHAVSVTAAGIEYIQARRMDIWTEEARDE
jgi:hypothetical protein